MPIVLAQTTPPAAVSSAPAGPITDPQWESVHAYPGEMEKYYPPGALAEAASGVAILECTVTSRGTLDACKALQESPAGMHFGDAAVKLAARFKMKTTTRSGASAVGRVVRMPIEFSFAWAMFEPINPRPSFDVLVSPKWAKQPTGQDLERFYPPEAVSSHTEGLAILECQVQPDGHLAPCSVAKEDPENYDFGGAALKLVTKLQVDVTRGPGLKAPGKLIDIPVRFVFPR
jgi:TonB family protein